MFIKQNSDRSRHFGRINDVISFDVTSYPTFLRNHTSAESINVKIGTIVHFDEKNSQKKNQTDSDTFDGLMTL